MAEAIVFADSAIEASIGKLMPGAVFVVTKDGEIVHNRAFGSVKTSTVFDLASVTKVMATTFAMMMLVDQGKVDLDAPVYTYLHDFRGPHLDSITPRHLLQHSAGLVQWQPLYYQAKNTQETYAAIRDMPLQWGVGEGRHYSDFSFMLLGDIVEKVTGKRLDVFIDSALYKPLGLTKTTFNPRKKGLKEFAPTELGNGYEKHMVYDSTFGYRYRGDPTSWNGWRNYQTVGEVNDGNSFYANGGVAGHAGLFSTGAELSVLLQVLLNGGTYDGRTYVSQKTIDRFLAYDKYKNFLGWQYPAQLRNPMAFSHTGFTGTYVLGDRLDRLSVVLLTNKQALGTNEKGFFPDLAPLQLAIAGAIMNAAHLDGGRSDSR
ncbi:MAG TPA: serine hydrolase [Gemmatimonadaceae bacterium]|nr:serine hydrolase [Gemmatimonadaceae bacterium]